MKMNFFLKICQHLAMTWIKVYSGTFLLTMAIVLVVLHHVMLLDIRNTDLNKSMTEKNSQAPIQQRPSIDNHMAQSCGHFCVSLVFQLNVMWWLGPLEDWITTLAAFHILFYHPLDPRTPYYGQTVRTRRNARDGYTAHESGVVPVQCTTCLLYTSPSPRDS